MNTEEIINWLKAHSNPQNLPGMARYGINTETALGVSMPALRKLAKSIGKNHPLALRLWETGIHEARILAALIDSPIDVEESQMEKWAADFNSWDLCDQCCMNLFDRTSMAQKMALEWSRREEEFVKRAAFAIMAAAAVHRKKEPDDYFYPFLEAIERESRDSRNMVKKAVNWALRQIGKRHLSLHARALALAEKLAQSDDKTARWIGKDAHRELSSDSVIERLRKKAKHSPKAKRNPA